LEGMERLAEMATNDGKTNVGFVSNLLIGNVEACADTLIKTKRLPEAALFVRTYLPSRIDEVVALWKEDLASVSETAAQALASPGENPDMFPDLDIGKQVEQTFLKQRDSTRSKGMPASDYLTSKDDLDLNLIELIKSRSRPPGEAKAPEPDEGPNAEDEAAAAIAAKAETARQAAEEEAAKAEEVRIAAEQKLAEEEAAKSAAATTAAAPAENDFGDDW